MRVFNLFIFSVKEYTVQGFIAVPFHLQNTKSSSKINVMVVTYTTPFQEHFEIQPTPGSKEWKELQNLIISEFGGLLGTCYRRSLCWHQCLQALFCERWRKSDGGFCNGETLVIPVFTQWHVKIRASCFIDVLLSLPSIRP